jgi:hypothetical protein
MATENPTTPAWVRAGVNTDAPRWGVAGHLEIGLWRPGGGDGTRGLIRLFYPIEGDGKPARLVNFIAVEPVVQGRGKGFSELEPSPHDGQPGMRLWAGGQPLQTDRSEERHGVHPEERHGVRSLRQLPLDPGTVQEITPGVEALSVTIRVEPFRNGAHPYLVATFHSDRPDEVSLRCYHEEDSAPMDYCILTATMGNFARLRRVWLKDRVVTSQDLYPHYDGPDFAHDTYWNQDQLWRTPEGDVLVPASTDEKDPASARPFGDQDWWWWPGSVFTQYWRKPAGEYRDDLHVRVNARRVYWASQQPIPGGISFENLELRERYYPGQVFVWGITARTPEEMRLKP